jgi:uncharacterized protein (DUF2235 family)
LNPKCHQLSVTSTGYAQDTLIGRRHRKDVSQDKGKECLLQNYQTCRFKKIKFFPLKLQESVSPTCYTKSKYIFENTF